MIIPPDPEKDPNVFSATSSTPSLPPPPPEPSETDSITRPERALTANPAFGYPIRDDLGLGYTGEALPPYQRHNRLSMREEREDVAENASPLMRERARRSIYAPPLVIPTTAHIAQPSVSEDESTPRASTSTAQLPYSIVDAPSTTAASTSNLWASSESRKGKSRLREKLIPPITLSTRYKRWWKRWRRWVFIVLGLIAAGIGVMIGLLVGLRVGVGNQTRQSGTTPPWKDVSEDGKHQNWVNYGEVTTLTYVPSRDGPTSADGNITSCPAFMPLNESSPILSLSRPFPGQTASIVKFEYPLSKNGTAMQVLPDFTFLAKGLGSSGTLDFVGQDAPIEVFNTGKEGVMTVEVVALYAGGQDLDSIVEVCSLQREDQGLGLGIFTPKETDNKVTNAYMVNPRVLPAFHVVVRLPPSALLGPTQSSVSIPSIRFDLERMSVRMGNLQNVAEFGNIWLNSVRGGLQAIYVAAKTIDVSTGDNAVRGRFNITDSIVVNNTEASILAEIILYAPDENSNATNRSEYTETQRQHVEQRGHGDSNWTEPATGILEGTTTDVPPQPTHSVITKFTTGEGIIQVSYIQHPARVALSAYLSTAQGEISASMHPNYVGSFVIQDIWGQVRMPPPQPIYQSDPLGAGRRRSMVLGDIDIAEGSIYASEGLNETVLENSPVALSGAVYWQSAEENKSVNASAAMAAREVQASDEGAGELLIMGAWGDVWIAFDGAR